MVAGMGRVQIRHHGRELRAQRCELAAIALDDRGEILDLALCLIQIATADRLAVVDPLAGAPLQLSRQRRVERQYHLLWRNRHPAGLPRRIMVDASHGNSGKDYARQSAVAESLAEQLTAGERGLVGVMLESFLVAGRQDPGAPETLTYGQSVTDGCMDILTTADVIARLHQAKRDCVG